MIYQITNRHNQFSVLVDANSPTKAFEKYLEFSKCGRKVIDSAKEADNVWYIYIQNGWAFKVEEYEGVWRHINCKDALLSGIKLISALVEQVPQMEKSLVETLSLLLKLEKEDHD